MPTRKRRHSAEGATSLRRCQIVDSIAYRGNNMNKNKLIAVSVFAAAMLAACSGGGGGDDYAAKLRGDKQTLTGAQTQMTAPAPTLQVQQVEVTRIVKDVQRVEVPATVVVPQMVQVVVTSTPEPGIEQPCDYMAVDAPMDAADKGAGVVRRGYMTQCAVATAQAMGVLPGGK